MFKGDGHDWHRAQMPSLQYAHLNQLTLRIGGTIPLDLGFHPWPIKAPEYVGEGLQSPDSHLRMVMGQLEHPLLQQLGYH